MRGELVAIDLETTGLNHHSDNIIEIGAVRLVDGQVTDEYSTLVNPLRDVPDGITHLTGIATEDVMNQPTIHEVLPDFEKFVGDAPLIAHNIAMDMGFLRRYGVFRENVLIDTYDLASVMLPSAPRYNLTSLTSQMEINLESAHRALDDARATALFYWSMWEKVIALPYATLREIAEASQGHETWGSYAVFDAAYRERTREIPVTNESTEIDLDSKNVFPPPDENLRALQPADHFESLDADLVTEVIGNRGPLAKKMANYEERPQQVAMTKAIVDAFNAGSHLLVEAGTGTGKSIAYLVPSIMWALQNNERVVISTNTINLQEQLVDKDIPLLKEVLNLPFRATIMKGRGNYLCPRRLAFVRRRRPTNVDDLRTFAKILVWLLETEKGDKGEINLRDASEHNFWQRLSADDESCSSERCQFHMGGTCPYYKARRAAEASHIIVVNHALLVLDAMTENRVLPEYDYVVVDEAHHIEDATTSGLSFRIDEPTLRRRINDLGGPNVGLLGTILSDTRDHIPEHDLERLESFVENIHEASTVMTRHVESLFNAIWNFLRESRSLRNSDFATQVRITDQMRSRDEFDTVRNAWEILSEFFEVISGALVHLAEALNKLAKYNIPNYEDLASGTASAARYLRDVRLNLAAFANEPDPNTIYWITVSQNNTYLSISTAPLHVGPLVEQHLWHNKESVILTSATLQTNGSFDYVRERLHAEEVNTLEVGSPFDYRTSTLIYIPDDMPEPSDYQRYQQAAERGLIDLAGALDGRVLGLFTSYSQLRQTSKAVTPRLALGNITVYDQSDGTSRQALLEGFKTTRKAVLLGTKSFWEGVDVPGESLSGLAIFRLPFAVPSDPIFASRSETYDNSFMEYAVPEAILQFRQGFGRLIRTRTDRGVVVIFDSRVITKRYGANFLRSLPDCTVHRGPLRDLAQIAKEWVDGEA